MIYTLFCLSILTECRSLKYLHEEFLQYFAENLALEI